MGKGEDCIYMEILRMLDKKLTTTHDATPFFNPCYELAFFFWVLYSYATFDFWFWRIVLFSWLEQNYGWSNVNHLEILNK